MDAILELVRAGRPSTTDIGEVAEHVAWGPGPRASQALMLGVRARAVLQGRLAPVHRRCRCPDPSYSPHRMALNFAARAEGVTMTSIIDKLVERIS